MPVPERAYRQEFVFYVKYKEFLQAHNAWSDNRPAIDSRVKMAAFASIIETMTPISTWTTQKMATVANARSTSSVNSANTVRKLVFAIVFSALHPLNNASVCV